MRIELQPAYVLHSRPFRDTSLLVEFFTQEYGRITLIAKGARSPKQRQRLLLQPFSPLLISWQGKNELKTLVGTEIISTAFVLEGYFLYSALYANELLIYLLAHDDAADDIYNLYSQLLVDLQGKSDLEPTLRNFEFSLLNLLGYGINFEFEALEGMPIQQDKYYTYRHEVGFVLEKDNHSNALTHYEGLHLIDIAQGRYNSSEAKKLAKDIVRKELSIRLQGKKINSRDLFK